MPTIAADLPESINLEHGSLWGHYDPEANPLGTRLKAAIQEAGNASTAIGLVSQNASLDPQKFAGVWYVVSQGSSSTVNLVSVLPKLEAAGVNVKVVAAISEELFDRQPEAYRRSVLPPEAYYDLMVVSTGTRRVWPLRGVGPLTDEYSLTSDWDNQWLTGGLEPDVIAEAHLDAASILAGIQRFGAERDQRMARQRAMLASLA